MANSSAQRKRSLIGLDYWEYAKELAQAERQLKIEHWVIISIEYRRGTGERIKLHTYDLPRSFIDRYHWVIRWRISKLQCLYPRNSMQAYYSHYDKRTGLKTGFSSALSKLAAAKAQITRAKNVEKAYIREQRQENMFFNEQTDELLLRFREKLAVKKGNYARIEASIREAVEVQIQHKND